jgi:hypothetical protein
MMGVSSRRRGNSPEAEEVLDLLVVSLTADILDVNGSRHVESCDWRCLLICAGDVWSWESMII